VRRFLLVLTAVLPLALATQACDNSLGLADPTIARDSSMILSAPTASDSIPSALDIPGFSRRRPEQLGDSQEWDFALRQEGTVLRLVPNSFPVATRRPLIFRSTESFAAIDRAPTARSAYGDSAVVLEEGAVYVMRSRHYSVGGGTCYAFGKMQVLDLNPAAGTAEFKLQANLGCVDARLEAD
jgi:hypothetical protein